MKKGKICNPEAGWGLLLAVLLSVLCMTGCQTVQNHIEDPLSQTDLQEVSAAASSVGGISVERADSFVLAYNREKTGLVISLTDCICEYDNDRVRIYSKYVNSYEWTTDSNIASQYVLYIQTPYETVQIFPVKDFLINQEREILYVLQEESSFKSIQKINDFRRKEGSVIQSERIILDEEQLKEMMEKAHKFSDSDAVLSELSFEFTALEQNNGKDILKGEASGIKNGEKYYVDFEWDESSGEGTASPCYDSEKNKYANTVLGDPQDSAFEEAMTDERFYEYEIKKDDSGSSYAVITGIAEAYKDDVNANLKKLTMDSKPYSWRLIFPETLEGVTVKEFAPYAFQNTDFGYTYTSLCLSSNITVIGEHCFEHCGLYDVTFERSNNRENAPVIGDRAFADNENLFGVYLNTASALLGEEVFTGCAKKMYLCYISESEEADKKLTEYAYGNNLEAVEIPLYFSKEPIVNYPETPLILTPEIRNFFYGESADGDDFCSFEYDDDAPDFGFPEWQLPCGESDAMIWSLDITATSELASPEEGKYDAQNMEYSDRKYVWAEGADGYGIGESISITESCGDGREWPGDGTVYFYEGDIEPDILDGYIRYTEICIVNGHAKNRKTWEENGRVKRLLMYVEDKPYAYLDLEDTIYPQYFKLPINDIKAADCVDIHFKFVIEDVYPGTKYEDTCLTGLQVEFIGRHSH